MKHKALAAGFCLSVLMLLSPAISTASTERGLVLATEPSFLVEALGNYHALIIGINKYREWNQLQTAVKDALELRNTLVEYYGFDEKNVLLRTDKEATRLQIINDLRYLALNLGETDNLLIYFAGHGQLDDLTGDGYWIPVEGKLKDPGTWISQATIKGILGSEKVRAKNVVVIADSCYSGTLLRGGPSLLKMEGGAYLDKLAEAASKRSRQVITSGGLEPVADGGRDGHSLFAFYLITALRENDRVVVDLENLFHTRVWEPVTQIGGQRPNVGRLKTPMDEDGQFVLINHGLKERKAALDDKEALEREQKEAQLRGEGEEWERLEAERRLLEAERRQLEEERRLLRERKTLEAERLALEKEKQLMALEAERKRVEEEKARISTQAPRAEPPTQVTSIPKADTLPRPRPAGGELTVAVLPWRINYTNMQGASTVNTRSSFDAIVKELASNRDLRLTHAAYSSSETAEADVKDLSLLPEESAGLWRKKGFLSRAEPDSETAAAIGRRLGVDLVIIVQVSMSDYNPKTTLSIIDTNTGRVLTETEIIPRNVYLDSLAQMTQRQLQQYLDETSDKR